MAATTDDLAAFVREALARRTPRDDIRSLLLAAGWPREKVERALAAFAEADFPIPVPRPRAYASPKEAFLYLLLFTSLMLAAFNLGALIFVLIDLGIPDPSRHTGSLRELRWHTAFVIVTFPVFLALAIRQQRELRRDPTGRASPVRKWLTYLTLFVAAGFLIGDLVTLVRYFLEGEMTPRFLLKVLTVAVIAGTGFTYYLGDLKKDDQWVAE